MFHFHAQENVFFVIKIIHHQNVHKTPRIDCMKFVHELTKGYAYLYLKTFYKVCQLMIKPIQIRLNIETATPTSTDTATSRLESKDNGFL